MGGNARLAVLVFIAAFATQTNCQKAILHVFNGSTAQDFCIVYNHSWTRLPQSLDDAEVYSLVNLTSTLLCDQSGVRPEEVKDKALVVMRGDCPFSQKAQVAQSLGASVLLIASLQTLVTPSADNYSGVHIPIALMRYRDFVEAQQVFDEGMRVRLYAPLLSKIDPSLFVMLLISIVAVSLAGYWNRACERDALRSSGGSGSGSEVNKADSGELSLSSPLKVGIYVALMCVMLILMFYFYKYLVYILIAMFCCASAAALFRCLNAVLEKLSCPAGSFTIRNTDLSVRCLILAAVCISVSVVWGVYRNEERWVWILQDILGFAFCINFIKTISLSNFKICVILLSLLLVYDVFFVFITPFFTKSGVSIMEQVALGPEASGEKLPVVMRIPRFSAWALNLCEMQFVILGYGDIIVPGLLVAYCSKFDVWINSKIYFFSSCLAYLLGMITTFAVMVLSNTGQPALLYLVPFTIIMSAAVAGYRGEMKHFWTGTSYEVLDSSREPLLTGA
uniref:signal peptide peptidase-like 2A isoform X2 n=1 Tax=Doryrhamphus excisus TaxID=161450 RepID=UPI0025AECD8B|nr:signal peptide peptidase-like 2A isoform X2 [Doryrhamphus excisus]